MNSMGKANLGFEKAREWGYTCFNKGSKFVSLEEGFFRLWTHEFPIWIEVGIPTVGNTFFDEYLFGQEFINYYKFEFLLTKMTSYWVCTSLVDALSWEVWAFLNFLKEDSCREETGWSHKVFMHKCIEESLSIISEPNWETRVNLCEKESLAVGFLGANFLHLASKTTQCNSYKGSVANFG